MTRILALDYRKKAPSGAPAIEVEYDPDKIQQFDTRGKCATKWQERWGQKVDVLIDGELCMLYLEHCGRTLGHTYSFKNYLKES